ncbi:hypothetical protein BS50DRAFT_628239 [Corynespora cassiicola Philippines]|uniref:Beta/gamma crystallin 'Greek key' domain-containing protein n=1 Tax=Corynespora cassiicola Philippines TaxID=1448308 RepID=A0A2T2PBH5_CORCC|nr:hypothetical protein BS50DRAFT_628239 [Corynespora cassiicola Philippines]
MKFMLTVLLATATPCFSASTIRFPKDFVKRTSSDLPTTHLYVCDTAGFSGRCENLHVTPGRCYNLNESWNKLTLAAGPDQGTFCSLFP